MKRTFFILSIFLTFSSLVFSDDLSEYPFILLKKIPTGQEEGLIGWRRASAGGSNGPNCFSITEDSIYIPDLVNARLNVYNKDLKFQRTIIEKDKKKLQYTDVLKIDNDGNLIYYTSVTGFRKLDGEGNTIFSIDKNQLKEKNLYKSIFLIDNDIFFYNAEDEIQYINHSGEIESPEKAVLD